MECTTVWCVQRIRQKSCRRPAVKNCRSGRCGWNVIRQTPLETVRSLQHHMRPPYSLRRNLPTATHRPCDRSFNGWINNREAGDLRRHHTHYGVSVMISWCQKARRRTIHSSDSLTHICIWGFHKIYNEESVSKNLRQWQIEQTGKERASFT